MSKHINSKVDNINEQLNQLQNKISYEFTQIELLRQAITHSSAANELLNKLAHNERLEFLGDAVLELCISNKLYKMYPTEREGQLTAIRSKLVNQSTLASISKEIKLDACLILGKGEENQGGRQRDSLLSDCLEALIGAVYLDSNFEQVSLLIEHLFAKFWLKGVQEEKKKNTKNLLQEVTQFYFKDRPIYNNMNSKGPEHAKEYLVMVTLPNGDKYTAEGASLKRAEQAAAELALKSLSEKGYSIENF